MRKARTVAIAAVLTFAAPLLTGSLSMGQPAQPPQEPSGFEPKRCEPLQPGIEGGLLPPEIRQIPVGLCVSPGACPEGWQEVPQGAEGYGISQFRFPGTTADSPPTLVKSVLCEEPLPESSPQPTQHPQAQAEKLRGYFPQGVEGETPLSQGGYDQQKDRSFPAPGVQVFVRASCPEGWEEIPGGAEKYNIQPFEIPADALGVGEKGKTVALARVVCREQQPETK